MQPTNLQPTSSAQISSITTDLPATEAKTLKETGTLQAQGDTTEHSVQKSYVSTILEKILAIFTKGKPSPETMKFMDEMKTSMGTLQACDQEVKSLAKDAKNLEHSSPTSISIKLAHAKKALDDLTNLEGTLKAQQQEPKAQSKSVQQSLAASLQQCAVLKDQCQHAVNVYQTKLGKTDPEMQSYNPEAHVEASPEKLTRQLQYLANSYDGKEETESMYHDEKLICEDTISNDLKGGDAKTITGPKQMLKDLGRTRVSVDGEPLANPKEAQKRGISTQFQVAEKLVEKFGESGLKKLGPIMHQSLFADFHSQLMAGRQDADGKPIDIGLGLGAPRNITPDEYRAQTGTSLSDEQLFKMLAPRFNIRENADGSIVVTGSLITGFIPIVMGDSEVDRYGFCEVTIEVTISKEEFAKADPKDMQLSVKASASEVVKPGYSQVEKFNAKWVKVAKKTFKAEQKKTEQLKKAAAAANLTKPKTTKKSTGVTTTSAPIESESLESLERKCNKLLFLKEPHGTKPLTDDMMSELAKKAATDPHVQKIVNGLAAKYSKGTEVTSNVTERGVPQEGGSRKTPPMTLSVPDYLLLQELIAHTPQKK